MKLNLIIAAIVTMLLASFNSYAKNHALLVASCPPWKHEGNPEKQAVVQQICAEDVKVMSNALSKKLDVDKQEQIILLQKDAILSNIKKALTHLTKQAEKGGTIYVYLNTHGGQIPHLYKGYPVLDEVFALYTEQKPKDYSKAVNDGVWVGARVMRDMVSGVAANSDANVVVIIEACHSEAAYHEIVHNPVLSLQNNSKLAMIFSAGKDQISTFNDQGDKARFTENLAQAISDAEDGQSLTDIVRIAQAETHRGAVKQCANYPKEEVTMLLKSAGQFFTNCMQEPTFYDPKLLMDDIKVN